MAAWNWIWNEFSGDKERGVLKNPTTGEFQYTDWRGLGDKAGIESLVNPMLSSLNFVPPPAPVAPTPAAPVAPRPLGSDIDVSSLKPAMDQNLAEALAQELGAMVPTQGASMAELDPSQSTLSPNFAPYVYDMLSRGQGLANLPYQEFTGQRFAGPSALQTQAFQGLAGLGTPPPQFGTASNLATQAGQAAGNLSYTPSGLPSFGQVSSGYQAPAAYQPGQFANQFTAPGAYQAGTFNTGLGAVGSVQDYMNPYTQNVTDITAREMRRQADIARNVEQARLAKAGAYGGSRQAIMEAERQRNLNTQLEDISTKGLQSAYDRALAQRFQEAQLGMEAQKAGEASRQFGATQGMTAADLAARYGLSAQQAAEQSRQFGATQGMTAAEQAARFGQSAQQANQQAALEAARQAEASRQFGAKYGLEGLQQQLEAARTLGSLGTQQQQAGIAGLQAQLGAGETQRQIAQQPLDFAYQQFQESMKYPYQQATFMQSLLQGLPLTARPYEEGSSALLEALKAGVSGVALYDSLFGKKPK